MRIREERPRLITEERRPVRSKEGGRSGETAERTSRGVKKKKKKILNVAQY